MVAITLGLLVLLAAGTLLAASNKAYVSQIDTAAVDDGGRFALDIVARAVRHAAYTDFDDAGMAPPVSTYAPARVTGLDNHFLNNAAPGLSAPRPGAVNGSDVLAVRFDGSGASAGGDGSMSSCAGFGVGRASEGWSIFYVAAGPGGVAELRCKYRGQSGWSGDAVVSGVDSFQVLYGIDLDLPADGLANTYLNASAVHALDGAMTLAGGSAGERARELNRRTHWKRVASIKVALVLHGPSFARADSEPAVFDLFGPGYSAAHGATDSGTVLRETSLPAALARRERRQFSHTITLRNPAQ
ncbi:MAG: PilW family protein [Pseudomonadota bacterium]